MTTTPHFSNTRNSTDHINIALNLSKKGAPQFFASKVEEGLARGITKFKIRIPSVDTRAFPNVCTPIAGMVEQYRDNRKCTFSFSSKVPSDSYPRHIGLLRPYRQPSQATRQHYLDKIWRFDTETHYEIVSGIVESIRAAAPINNALLNCFELCLNEITDNVLNHSLDSPYHQNAHGYVMAQMHSAQHRIAISVFDTGRGIFQSLREGGVHPANAHEAIALSITEGVTDGNGAGKGLWMLHEIVKHNSGSLDIVSDGARYSFRRPNRDVQPAAVKSVIRTFTAGTTLVDFQLNTNQETSISMIIPGYQFTDLWAESREYEVEGDLRLTVKDEASGLGSRLDSGRFANIVYSAVTSASGKVVLDFEGIQTISFSFADELIVRLLGTLGMTTFMKKIEFANLSNPCQAIIDNAMQSRLEK